METKIVSVLLSFVLLMGNINLSSSGTIQERGTPCRRAEVQEQDMFQEEGSSKRDMRSEERRVGKEC